MTKQGKTRSRKEYVDDTLEKLDASQVAKEPLAEDSVKEPSEDLEPSEFTENIEGSAYGAETKGSEEVDKSTRSERFAIEHEDVVTKESTLRDTIKKKTDKPSDENAKT